jgi:diacylglycerol O-acyltransferase
MGLADAAWLGLDRPEHLMVVTVVLRLGTRVELDAVRELAADRLVSRYPKFRQRPVRSRWPLVPPSWRDDPGFTIANHVTEGELAAPTTGGTEAALMAYAGELMGTPLDLEHAPWTLTLVQLGDRSALLARLHHCLADGIALAGVLLSLVDDPGPRPASAAKTTERTARPSRSALAALSETAGTAVRTISKVMVGRKDTRSRLRGPASVGRRAAWTSPLDLEVSKTSARRLGVSVNDVLLAAVAGGLRDWLLGHGEAAADCRVMVPVDLRRGADVSSELGNRFGVVFITLPVSVASRAERVAQVRAATTEAKSSSTAAASYGLLGLVGLMPRWGQGFAANLLGRIATAIVTNVPGPRAELTMVGAPLTSVVFWVPHIGPIGIGVSIFSYAGTVTLGVATNSSLDIDPHELVAAIETELSQING